MNIPGRHQHQRGQRGQSMIEILPVLVIMLTMIFAVIDLSRAILQLQTMSSLSREGSNLASRNNSATALSDAVATVISDGSRLSLSTQGAVILTSVQNNGGTMTITGQARSGTLAVTSRVGSGTGVKASLPASSPTYPAPGGTIYVTEIFSSYSPITPVGALAKLVMPSSLYDIAYY